MWLTTGACCGGRGVLSGDTATPPSSLICTKPSLVTCCRKQIFAASRAAVNFLFLGCGRRYLWFATWPPVELCAHSGLCYPLARREQWSGALSSRKSFTFAVSTFTFLIVPGARWLIFIVPRVWGNLSGIGENNPSGSSFLYPFCVTPRRGHFIRFCAGGSWLP